MESQAAQRRKSVVSHGSMGSDKGRVQATSHISRIMSEVSQKEQRCRDNFEANALTLRKPRNPCTGELTSRENAPFLIPLEKIMKDNMESESYIKFEKTKVDMAESLNRQSMILALPVKQRDVLKVSRVRKLRSEVDREIETLKRVAEYKKDQLQRLTQSKFSGHVDQTNS